MIGEIIINDGEPFQVNRFIKGSNQITNSIEKMIDIFGETLEMLILVYQLKYAMVLNQIKRSTKGEGCDEVYNFLEIEGQLCFLPTGIACFRKC